ncbi:MAG: HesA/MoeB/ThiF family protein [Desulfobacteraceae bacterium]|nr:HesA/MoeB/ThiF family protein [Desulfobacteraceae bacterium]
METRDSLNELERLIYARNVLLPGVGEAGQLRLMRSRVLLIGLGGLGSPVLYYLAAAGVGEIGIADGDSIEPSNLQRQILHGRPDIGLRKVDSAARTVARLNPDVRLRPCGEITPSNVLQTIAQYDFIIEATDNYRSKFLINDACAVGGKPFSHAGATGMRAQTMTFVPGAGPCFRCVFEDEPEAGSYDTSDRVGILGSVAGAMGAIQATEALKYLLGIGNLLVGRLLTWDARTMAFREVQIPVNERCSACGQRSTGAGKG